MFPTLCQARGLSLPEYKIFRRKGDTHDFLPPVFHTTAYHEFSVLELDLPPDVAEDPNELVNWVTELAEAFPFRCGTVGYSLCWNDGSADRVPVVPNLVAPFYKRYPGFAWATPGEIADHPLPPVNWLTLLGPEVTEKLGGIEQVRKDLKDDAISVQPMGSGLCIRAGEAPQLGDRNRGDDLPLYRKVGSYLKPYRGNEYIEFDGFDAHGSEAWLARFDD
ncbi:MAG TPA: type VI immunity family protein [Polyangiaceae bacterium]